MEAATPGSTGSLHRSAHRCPESRWPRVVAYLDAYLRIGEVPDERNALNGLQVENAGGIGSIVAAVDASQATIDGVAARGGRRFAPAAGPSRALLGWQSPRYRTPLSPHSLALRTGHRSLLRAYPARSPSRGRQQRRPGRASRHRSHGLVRRLSWRADRCLGTGAAAPGRSRLARPRDQSRARRRVERSAADSRRPRGGGAESASLPARRAT